MAKVLRAAPLLLIYIGSIIAANWLTTSYGLIPVAPGLTATAGTFAVGGVIMTRDLLQDAAGRAAIITAIIAGAGISYGVSSHQIALASGITFLLAESAEMVIYTPLRRRAAWGTGRWAGVVAIANATGILADTMLFLWLAGFPVTGLIVAGQLTGKAYVTLGVAAAGLAVRRAVPNPAIDTARA
jgi:uncharacterized PurR-regulated membrane protein YhhQ (DUF165 family)